MEILGTDIIYSPLLSPLVTLIVSRDQRLFVAHESILSRSPFFDFVLRDQFPIGSVNKALILSDEYVLSVFLTCHSNTIQRTRGLVLCSRVSIQRRLYSALATKQKPEDMGTRELLGRPPPRWQRPESIDDLPLWSG